MDTPTRKAQTVQDIPGFPFASYAEFVEAHAAGEANVWIRPDLRTAWQDRQFGSVFVWSWGGWISLAFAIAAILTRRWELLGGSVTSFLAWWTARGLMTCCDCAPMMAVVLFLLSPLMRGLPLIFAGACLLIWVTTGAALGAIDTTFRAQMLESEARFLFLWNRRIITDVERKPELSE